jgi:uncharacterized membrane protein (DUF485 family)
MALQSWDEHRENHGALMRLLDRKREPAPYVEMRRWRRRFWWLLAMILILFLWLFLLAKT